MGFETCSLSMREEQEVPSPVVGAAQAPRSSLTTSEPLRILCIGEMWYGSDARAAIMAFIRAGHVVEIVDELDYIPNAWRSTRMRIVRKLFRRLIVEELSSEVKRQIRQFQPHALFVFKGAYVDAGLLRMAREYKVASVNYYPDVSVTAHGPFLPKALPLYDHVFTTKSYGPADMWGLGVIASSFLAPGHDPELHRSLTLSAGDIARYGCDVAFIGTWSPKKERLLASLASECPEIRLRVWGMQWERHRSPSLGPSIEGRGAVGEEYVRAISGAKICLGLLSEARTGSSSGDLITARTFQIPACGTFMLHERNTEAAQYFREGEEAGFFAGQAELSEKTRYFLANPSERQRIADAGHARALREYAIDERMRTIAEWMRSRVEANG
jgi:spore maturation protein CgeB